MSSDSLMASGTRSGSTSGSIGGRPASPPTGAYMSSRIVNGPTRPPLAGETAIYQHLHPRIGRLGPRIGSGVRLPSGAYLIEPFSPEGSRRGSRPPPSSSSPRCALRSRKHQLELHFRVRGARLGTGASGGTGWAGSGAMVREGGCAAGECGSAVSGRGGRARVRGIGRAGAVLHIRPGPVGGGSAESCGNAPAFNAVEILPCAEGPALHMGTRPLRTNILGRTPESRGKLEVDPWGATLSDVQHHRTGWEELPPNRQRPSSRRSTPARAGKSSLTEAPLPSDEAVPPQPAREDRTLGPAGRGAGAAPPHGPGRTRPARQRPSAPAPARSPNPTRTPRKTAPTVPIPDPGPPILMGKARSARSR